MTRRFALVALFLVAAAARPAAAASCTAFASSLVFGDYAGSTLDVTGTITVTCTSGTPYRIGLNAGNTPGATVTNRLMFGGTGGQNTLGYQLFSDAARTINWGNTIGTNWVSGTGNGSAQPYTIYARIPANQASPQGSYTDTITASITGNFTTATAQFSVTATVVLSCRIAASDLNFGSYTGKTINATSGILVDCPSGAKFDIGLSTGTARGANVSSRSMTGPGGASLGYGLYRNARRTLNWGNTPGVDTEPGTGNANGRAELFTVWGQIPAGQSANPGVYQDTVTATVYF
jgi:spore coat protein U-like protein